MTSRTARTNPPRQVANDAREGLRTVVPAGAALDAMPASTRPVTCANVCVPDERVPTVRGFQRERECLPRSLSPRVPEEAAMPAREEMPSTIRRSPKKAQETWAKTHDAAVETYGEGERSHRTAFSALKHSFEKVGDHWEPKGRKGPSDEQAERSY